MAKVTSKYQVTMPKRIAEEYGIQPGDDIDWVPAGDAIRVIPPGRKRAPETGDLRLHWFDQATERHRKRRLSGAAERPRGRGWRREDLYRRGRSH